MKQLRKGSKGEEVKILQALIGDEANGIFSEQTRIKLIQTQKEFGIVADGRCGAATWKALGFVETRSSRLYVMRIPFSKIEFTRVILHDNCSAYSVLELAREVGANIALNAGLFSTGKGKGHWKNASDIVVSGRFMHEDKYSDFGIAFGKEHERFHAWQSTSDKIAGLDADFISGTPPLMADGKTFVDMKGLNKGFFNQRVARMALGIAGENLYIITTGRQHRCHLSTILYEGIHQELDTLINLDGDLHTSMALYGQCAFGTGINIPSAIALKIKD